MKLQSRTEWDPLKVVILGTVEDFSPAMEYPRSIDESDLETGRALAAKAYPGWYLDEVAEDLDQMCQVFEQAGATVLRPRWTEATPEFSTPNWRASGFDIYNVRDLHLVVDNTLIASAPSARFRLFESHALQELIYDHFFDDDLRWIQAPLPRLADGYVKTIGPSSDSLHVREDELHRELSSGLIEEYHRLEEDEVIFDAANVIRLGDDLLYLVSSTGNRKAARWLQNVLGDDYRVHITHTYRSSHLDSTILPLREGLVLLNGARVSEETCPAVFEDWDKIYFTDVAPVPEGEVEFHRDVRLPVYRELQDIGIETTLKHMSSPWAGLNVLSLDPGTVLVHDRQEGLIKELEARDLEVVPMPLRHAYTMLGGLHCSTLDLVRTST